MCEEKAKAAGPCVYPTAEEIDNGLATGPADPDFELVEDLEFEQRFQEAQQCALQNRFSYHSPKPGQPAKYADVRSAGLNLAEVIMSNAPGCAEQALAVRKAEEAVFWANAAIARYGE